MTARSTIVKAGPTLWRGLLWLLALAFFLAQAYGQAACMLLLIVIGQNERRDQ